MPLPTKLCFGELVGMCVCDSFATRLLLCGIDLITSNEIYTFLKTLFAFIACHSSSTTSFPHYFQISSKILLNRPPSPNILMRKRPPADGVRIDRSSSSNELISSSTSGCSPSSSHTAELTFDGLVGILCEQCHAEPWWAATTKNEATLLCGPESIPMRYFGLLDEFLRWTVYANPLWPLCLFAVAAREDEGDDGGQVRWRAIVAEGCLLRRWWDRAFLRDSPEQFAQRLFREGPAGLRQSFHDFLFLYMVEMDHVLSVQPAAPFRCRTMSLQQSVRVLPATLGLCPLTAPLCAFLCELSAERKARPSLLHSDNDNPIAVAAAPRVTRISKDQWRMIGMFLLTQDEASLRFHKAEDSWPSILDSFVSWQRERERANLQDLFRFR